MPVRSPAIRTCYSRTLIIQCVLLSSFSFFFPSEQFCSTYLYRIVYWPKREPVWKSFSRIGTAGLFIFFFFPPWRVSLGCELAPLDAFSVRISSRVRMCPELLVLCACIHRHHVVACILKGKSVGREKIEARNWGNGWLMGNVGLENIKIWPVITFLRVVRVFP